MTDEIIDDARTSTPKSGMPRAPMLLPPSAETKLAHLRMLHDDAAALLSTVSGGGQPDTESGPEIQYWRREVEALEKADWSRIIADKLKASKLPKAEHDELWKTEKARLDARLEAAQAKLEHLLAERDRARDLHTRRRDRRQRTGGLAENVERWLEQQSGILNPVSPPPINLAGGQTLDAALASSRELIEAVTAERKRVEAAGPPPTEAKRLAREWVNRQSQRVRVRATGDAFGLMLPAVDGAVVLSCFLSPEKVVARLERAIDEQSDGRLTLSELDRAKKLVELDTKLLATQRYEEALVTQLEAEGRDVLRRRNADPRAVLGVE